MMATDEAKHPDHAGVAFHPPLLLMASLGVGFLLRWLAPLSVSTSTVPAMIGPAIVALAFAIFFWAVVTMLRGHASTPTNKPTDAITPHILRFDSRRSTTSCPSIPCESILIGARSA